MPSWVEVWRCRIRRALLGERCRLERGLCWSEHNYLAFGYSLYFGCVKERFLAFVLVDETAGVDLPLLNGCVSERAANLKCGFVVARAEEQCAFLAGSVGVQHPSPGIPCSAGCDAGFRAPLLFVDFEYELDCTVGQRCSQSL